MTTYVYTVFDRYDVPLYVGITEDPLARWKAHKTDKSWWDAEVHHFSLEPCATREEAARREREEITRLGPKYNMNTGNRSYPLAEPKRPHSYARLPQSEVDYLNSLTTNTEIYDRCSELRTAGWSVAAIAREIKITPTAVALRLELRDRAVADTGVPVPVPPPSRQQEIQQRKAETEARNYISPAESAQLASYVPLVKRFRPHHTPSSATYRAVEAYSRLITDLHDRGVSFAELARHAGVSESNIRRRYKKV